MKRKDFFIHVILAVAVLLTFYPFIFLIVTSLKTNDQFMHHFWGITRPFHWENYKAAWEAIDQYILNSVIVAIFSVTGVLTVASLSAYAFARHRFPGSTILFYAIISLMMIPGVLTLISSFMWIKDLHLMNTRLALVLPYIAGGQVFAIFILRSFMASIPEELFEAARMDGASELRMFWNIAIPLSMPILGTVAIMNLLGVWNDYIWPLIVISDEAKRTLTIGLAFFRGTYYVNYGTLMAGYVIACLPLLVLFFIAMRYFVEGLTSGALKA